MVPTLRRGRAVLGSGLRVWGLGGTHPAQREGRLGFWGQGLGFGVWGLGFRGKGLGLRVWGLGFRV